MTVGPASLLQRDPLFLPNLGYLLLEAGSVHTPPQRSSKWA